LITGLPISIGNLRILPGNEVLLGTNNGVLRISADGKITQTYTASRQFALDPDRRSFWAYGTDRLVKIDLMTGQIVASSDPYQNPCCFTVDSIGVVGEPRAAVSPGASIPTLSQWVLIALAMTVAGAGFWRLRP